MPEHCDYDERPVVARLRWTVYGGAFKYAHVCRDHLAVAYGQRGVDWLCPDCGRPVVQAGRQERARAADCEVCGQPG
jgi:predicted RNA-binding Zn-ribbon protein involved in translation (DUF1610 family)